MKIHIGKFNRNLLLTSAVLIFSLVFGFSLPTHVFGAGPTTVNLGTAGNYVILSKTLITTTGATAITGDIGISPADSTFVQGFGLTLDGSGTFSTSSLVTGKVYAADYTAPTPATLTTAVSAMEAAYTDASGRPTPDGTNLYAGIIGGQTFIPGLYKWTTGVTIPTDITLSGGPSDVWIFQIDGTLDISANKKVLLSGGALTSNIFWAVAGTTTLEPGSTFEGTILGGPGTSTIAGQSGAILHGRALGQKDVSLIANTVSALAPTSATLNVIKHVITNNGGAAVTANDWTLAVTSSNGGSGTGSALGSETGTTYTLQAGKAYSVAESGGPSGYLESDSANCIIGSAVAGNTYTCTITNDDIAPQLIVTKIVVGGPRVISDFPLFVNAGLVVSGVTNTFPVGAYTVTETTDSNYTSSFSGSCPGGSISLALGDLKTCTITNTYNAPAVSASGSLAIPPLIDVVKVPSPLALPNGPGPVTYTYTLRNIGIVPVSNVTTVGDSCSPLTLTSGDVNNNSVLDLNETWIYHCTTILSTTHTNTVTATGWANGISAIDIASATVVVGLPVLVPPLIHVTKVPNPLALFAGGGVVTYTNQVTNPGLVPLTNIVLTDDKCGPVQYVSGDTNNDFKLDVNETWTYTCQSRLNQTTTNTVTVTGSANGLTVRDFAIATVVVSVPRLPNTGFPPKNNNILIALSGICATLVVFYIVRKKQIA